MAGSFLNLPTAAIPGAVCCGGANSDVIFAGEGLLSVAFGESASLYTVMRCGIRVCEKGREKERENNNGAEDRRGYDEARSVSPGHVETATAKQFHSRVP